MNPLCVTEKKVLAVPKILQRVLMFYLWGTNIELKLPLFSSKGKLDIGTLQWITSQHYKQFSLL